MKPSGYYSSGEFARMAHVSQRTIRYYDQAQLLKPSYLTPSGARCYSPEDLVRLQQILMLKYLGFSLADIREMTTWETDSTILRNTLNLQKKLILDRIEQMQLVADSIDSTIDSIDETGKVDWSRLLALTNLTAMESSMKNQYQDASNISARIRLHQEYSVNPQGWFSWIFEQCHLLPGMRILELGCGNGELWSKHLSLLPKSLSITLSDISEGMLRDARRDIGADDPRFNFSVIDCHTIPFADESFDLVIANHVLFYCRDLSAVCKESARVLSPEGRFLCSTYSSRHMKEITELVQEFDDRIVLSADCLYERFGLENGAAILSPFFPEVELRRYEDEIILDIPQPLTEYILSCHGNQNRLLLERYGEFRNFLARKMKKPFHITKDAGIFVCRKKSSCR